MNYLELITFIKLCNSYIAKHNDDYATYDEGYYGGYGVMGL